MLKCTFIDLLMPPGWNTTTFCFIIIIIKKKHKNCDVAIGGTVIWTVSHSPRLLWDFSRLLEINFRIFFLKKTLTKEKHNYNNNIRKLLSVIIHSMLWTFHIQEFRKRRISPWSIQRVCCSIFLMIIISLKTLRGHVGRGMKNTQFTVIELKS